MSLGKYRALVKKRRELREEQEYLDRKAELAQLNLKINPELKEALQSKYGRNLAKLFEEQMIEKLEKDGFQFDKKKKDKSA
jgi:hypothetical protein